MFAEVAVNSGAPHRQTFSYAIPEGIEVGVGHAVYVPFGRRVVQGVVLALAETAPVADVRPIARLASPEPVIDAARAELVRWVAAEYLAPMFPSAVLALPPGFDEAPHTVVTLLPGADGRSLSEGHRKVLAALEKAGGEMELAELGREAGVRLTGRVLPALERRGVVRRISLLRRPRGAPRTERHLRPTGKEPVSPPAGRAAVAWAELRTVGTAPAIEARRRHSPYAVKRLIDLGLLEEVRLPVERDVLSADGTAYRPPPGLFPAQREAVAAIAAALGRPRQPWFLLHGPTGSGKTEVYLGALDAAVERGKRAIVLVPDISLTPQTVRRFAERFPGRVAVLHSRLSMSERFERWHAIRKGGYDVVIGPRGALFAPQPDLGLIIVDEEHEWTYKQEQLPPRYDARAAAMELARISGATLVFGSATPDVVTYYQATEGGQGRLLELPERLAAGEDGRPPAGLPEVAVVDLKAELLSGNTSIFSRSLLLALKEVLEAGEQAILFLNRRGSAGYLLCRNCGRTPDCASCRLPLTVHEYEGMLICHHCGRKRQRPLLCPACGSDRLRPIGIGTQRVELEVMKTLPKARVQRWDRDVTRTAGAHEEVFDAFAGGRADILVGTQMVAKGLDLPNVTLVGVVLADHSLSIPDYRSAERTFQLLTQVAGRAGRRERKGRVIIQTYRPEHPAVLYAAAQDYEGFFAEEVAARRRLGYPPFGRLALLTCQDNSLARVENAAAAMAARLRETAARLGLPGVEVKGPAPPLVERLRGRYRRVILVRAPEPRELLRWIEPREGWAIDIDPASVA